MTWAKGHSSSESKNIYMNDWNKMNMLNKDTVCLKLVFITYCKPSSQFKTVQPTIKVLMPRLDKNIFLPVALFTCLRRVRNKIGKLIQTELGFFWPIYFVIVNHQNLEFYGLRMLESYLKIT